MILRAALLMLGLLCALPAQAACRVSATTLAFSSYNPFSILPRDQTGRVTVTCDGVLSALLVSYRIKLSAGLYGSYATRKLGTGSDRLNYNLYLPPPLGLYTVVWGDGSGGSAYLEDSYLLGILTQSRNYDVYGRIPAQQNVAPGTYGDTITVTLEY
ncbi:MAG TPA: spore coat U domain-containing protein [Solimonas sp.]|nr:spore coat U domain-containing protein [Solimonas sp.]